MPSPFHALPLAAFLAIAAPSILLASDMPPKFDVEKSCEASFAADAGAGKQRIPSCIEDEKSAGVEIDRDWTKFPPREREHCQALATMGGTPSYVEMLTCLQIARDTKTLPTDIKKSGLPK